MKLQGQIVMLAVAAGVLLSAGLSGCRSVKRSEVSAHELTQVHAERVERATADTVVRWRTDTVREVDKVWVYDRGDTVVVWRDCWHERTVECHDTLVQWRESTEAVADSVAEADSIERVVEKQLGWWDRFRLDTYLYIAAAALLAAVSFLAKIFKK